MDPKMKAAKLAALENVKHGLGEYLDEDAIGALGAKRKPEAEAHLKDQEEGFWEEARGEDPDKAKDALRFLATKYSDLSNIMSDFDEDMAYETVKNGKKPMVIANENRDGGVDETYILKSEKKDVDASKLSKEAREMLKKIKDLTTVPEGEGFLDGAKKGLDRTKERQMKLQQQMRDSMKGMEDLVKKDPALLTPEELKKIQDFVQKAKGAADAGE